MGPVGPGSGPLPVLKDRTSLYQGSGGDGIWQQHVSAVAKSAAVVSTVALNLPSQVTNQMDAVCWGGGLATKHVHTEIQ